MLAKQAMFGCRTGLNGTRSAFNPMMAGKMMTSSRDFRAAVVFHGSGVYDGTETTEGVALLVGLSRIGADV